MNLWKITDFCGRTYYYEDEKNVRKRLKMAEWDYRHFTQVHGNQAHYRQPQCHQVIGDAWVPTQPVPLAEMTDYLAKRQDKQDRADYLYKQRMEKMRQQRQTFTRV